MGSGLGPGFGLAMAGLNTTSEDRRQNKMSELFDSSPWAEGNGSSSNWCWSIRISSSIAYKRKSTG